MIVYDIDSDMALYNGMYRSNVLFHIQVPVLSNFTSCHGNATERWVNKR